MNEDVAFFSIDSEESLDLYVVKSARPHLVMKVKNDSVTLYGPRGEEILTATNEDMADGDFERILDAAWKEVGFGLRVGHALAAIANYIEELGEKDG